MRMYLTHQASPHDPENFPFVVLGNKIDMEESKRMVSRHRRARTVIEAELLTCPGVPEASNDLVSGQGQHSILRDIGQRGHQCRTGFPDYRQERFGAGGGDGIVSFLRRSHTQISQLTTAGMPITPTPSELTPRALRTMAVTVRCAFELGDRTPPE